VLLRRTGGYRLEPAGAAGVAALLRHPDLAVGTTAVVLSGGNADLDTASRIAALAARQEDLRLPSGSPTDRLVAGSRR
jgi:threonine dehydratase